MRGERLDDLLVSQTRRQAQREQDAGLLGESVSLPTSPRSSKACRCVTRPVIARLLATTTTPAVTACWIATSTAGGFMLGGSDATTSPRAPSATGRSTTRASAPAQTGTISTRGHTGWACAAKRDDVV